MANLHEKSFNYEKKRFAKRYGQPFSVFSIDYTSQDQTPSLIHGKKMYKAEVQSTRFAMSPLPNANYFCLHGDYDAINAGDILFPLRSDTNTPKLTVLNKSPFEEIVGFRTSRLGAIYNGPDLLYDNVYFEFCTTTNYPGSPLHRLAAATDRPENQAVMYPRVLRTSGRDTEGLLLKETDGNVTVTWAIKQDVTVGGLTELTLVLSEVE